MDQTPEGGKKESKRQDPREQVSDCIGPFRAWEELYFFHLSWMKSFDQKMGVI